MTGRRVEGLLNNIIDSGAVKKDVSNALKKTLTGASAYRIDDASPLIHPLNIKVTGTSTQDGTPTPAAPIPITHSSVLVESGEHAGEYSTSVTVSVSGGETNTATIYTAEPLRQGDVWDVLGGTVTKNMRIKELFGEYLDLFKNTQDINNYIYYATMAAQDTTYNGLCTHFASVPHAAATAGSFNITRASGVCYINFTGLLDTNDVTSALAWLTENRPILEYKLATPVTIPVTAFTLNSLNGTMTVTADGTAEVTYNRDINAAIDEILTAIAALGTT